MGAGTCSLRRVALSGCDERESAAVNRALIALLGDRRDDGELDVSVVCTPLFGPRYGDMEPKVVGTAASRLSLRSWGAPDRPEAAPWSERDDLVAKVRKGSEDVPILETEHHVDEATWDPEEAKLHVTQSSSGSHLQCVPAGTYGSRRRSAIRSLLFVLGREAGRSRSARIGGCTSRKGCNRRTWAGRRTA
jgi:hypothetical protein